MTLPARPVITRYALAALTAWLLPSYVVLAAMTAMVGEFRFEPMGLIRAPLLGLLFGWPCFLLGGAAWAVLHRAGQVRALYAALIGAAVPLLPIGYFLFNIRGWETGVIIVVLPIVAIGAATGLAVWRIAYPRAVPVS